MRSVPKLHLTTLAVLYGLLAAGAALEGTLFIRGGIGIVQNPPFLAHLFCGALAIYLPSLIARRIDRALESREDDRLVTQFRARIERSKLKHALFQVALLVGLISLAYTVTLSAQPTIDIYDSVQHRRTFLLYLLIRTYLYLFAYPAMVSWSLLLVYALFRSLRSDVVPYLPFHHDDVGGLRRFFVAVDRPVYAIQSAAVLVAVANIAGWGGMLRAPLVLSIAAPMLATVFALMLWYEFNRVVAEKRDEAVREIRNQQMQLYPAAKALAALAPRECLDLLERIDAMERLIDVIRKRRPGGWQKYVANIAVVAVTQLAKPVGALLAARLFGS